MVNSEELVPGDILLVEAGDVATADARLVTAANLSVDELALTGESVPVEKSLAPVAGDAAIGDRSPMLHKGTAVTRGNAVAVVTATGMSTELGQVARLAAAAAPEDSPLTKSLARLSRHLVLVTLLIAAAVASIGIVQGQSPMLMVEAAIALAVAAIPEGLPIVATLALARGMWRMARKNALIERLSAVETLGATTVILTDKTGTLTENCMAVHRLVTAAGDAVVEDREMDGAEAMPAPALRLLTAAALCNDAVLKAAGQPDSGDPLEIALLRAAHRAGLEPLSATPRLPRGCPATVRQRHPHDGHGASLRRGLSGRRERRTRSGAGASDPARAARKATVRSIWSSASCSGRRSRSSGSRACACSRSPNARRRRSRQRPMATLRCSASSVCTIRRAPMLRQPS